MKAKSKALGDSKFIKKLEAHKKKAAAFERGTWKPSHKGESFIDALERHKSQSMFYR